MKVYKIGDWCYRKATKDDLYQRVNWSTPYMIAVYTENGKTVWDELYSVHDHWGDLECYTEHEKQVSCASIYTALDRDVAGAIVKPWKQCRHKSEFDKEIDNLFETADYLALLAQERAEIIAELNAEAIDNGPDMCYNGIMD